MGSYTCVLGSTAFRHPFCGHNYTLVGGKRRLNAYGAGLASSRSHGPIFLVLFRSYTPYIMEGRGQHPRFRQGVPLMLLDGWSRLEWE